MKKPLETAWVGLQAGRDGVSGNHLGGANSVSQVNGVSDMVPASGSVGKGLIKGTMTSASTSVWEKDAQLALALMPENSVPH